MPALGLAVVSVFEQEDLEAAEEDLVGQEVIAGWSLELVRPVACLDQMLVQVAAQVSLVSLAFQNSKDFQVVWD